VEFAAAIGAVDLKKLFDYSEYHGLFKRSNYFLLDKDTFLVIKTSRSKIKPFYGLARPVYEQVNTLTHEAGTYFLVALDTSRSGWVLLKEQLIGQKESSQISFSGEQDQYKINNYNFGTQHRFHSPEAFLGKVRGQRRQDAYDNGIQAPSLRSAADAERYPERK